MMQYTLILLLLFLSVLPMSLPVQAAKPRARTPVARSGGSSAVAGFSKARLSRPTNSVVLTLVNLTQITRARYTLSYTSNSRSNPQQQGVVGSIAPGGAATETRDLYFGTCSHGVCTPHYQITGATLTVETTLKSGKTHVKRYRIKI